MISGPWGSPRIYPEMQGILDNPDAAYAKLKEMGKGLFGEKGAGIGAAIGSLLGGQKGTAGGDQGAAGGQAGTQPSGPLGGQLGETLGNLLQKGISGLGQSQGQGGGRPGGQRSIPSRTSPAEASTEPTQDAPAAEPIPPAPPDDTTAQQDSQPMNDVLRQLFNR
jgi:AsmA protein